MMKNNYLLPKIFGSIAISAVMIIGVYVLIIDLPDKKNGNDLAVIEQKNSQTSNTKTAQDNTQPSAQPSSNQESQTSPTSSTSTTTTSSSGGSTTTTPTTPATPTSPTPTPTPTYLYNTNTYSKSKTYDIPSEGLTWTLTATINIDQDIITSVSTQQPTSGKSQMYYNNFYSSLSSAVVGKKIDGLSIGILGNATYTSEAFNAILSLVRSAAKK